MWRTAFQTEINHSCDSLPLCSWEQIYIYFPKCKKSFAVSPNQWGKSEYHLKKIEPHINITHSLPPPILMMMLF